MPNVDVATHANVSASATSVQLFGASTNAVEGRGVFNDSTATLYLKWGTAASTTSFVTKVAPGALYEFPRPIYRGVVHGIWDSATGTARTTETS